MLFCIDDDDDDDDDSSHSFHFATKRTDRRHDNKYANEKVHEARTALAYWRDAAWSRASLATAN